MHKSRLKTWAHISLLAANIIYGVNYSIAKAVMPDHIKPLALVALRSISSSWSILDNKLFFCQRKKLAKKICCIFLAAHFSELLSIRFFFWLG